MKARQVMFALLIVPLGGVAGAVEPATYRCERLHKCGVPSAVVNDINDLGTAVGTFSVQHDGWHPAIWQGRKAEVLPYVTGHEGAMTQVWSINADGHPVPLEAAWTINNHGQILATGRNAISGPAALRLTPLSGR